MPVIVRWWCAPLWPGSATAKPANSITTSEGIGMQALEIAINAKMPGSPASRTKCEVSLTSVSEIEARTNITRSVAFEVRCGSSQPASAGHHSGVGPRTGDGGYRAADARMDRSDEQPARAGHAARDRAA